MKILAISDLHGRTVEKLLGFEDVDMVLMLGDITTGGSLAETRERIEPLREAYPELYVIPGNWERPDSVKWLEDEGLSFEGKAVRKEGVLLYGAGGSVPTPFNTPNEMNEEDMAGKLRGCPEPNEGERLILCSHTPPFGACDKVMLGKHVGSKAVRRFAEERSPKLLLCGHIHEARGKEAIGSTVVANPGTAPRHYAMIEIGEEIEVELH